MLRIKAHFDGEVFVPDERVDLPNAQAVILDVNVSYCDLDEVAALRAHNEALQRILNHPKTARGLPEEAFDRDAIYEDRD